MTREEAKEALEKIADLMAQPKDRISVINIDLYEKLRLQVMGIIKQALGKTKEKHV